MGEITLYKKKIRVVVTKEDIHRMIDICFELENECNRARCLKAFVELIQAALEKVIPDLCTYKRSEAANEDTDKVSDPTATYYSYRGNTPIH